MNMLSNANFAKAETAEPAARVEIDAQDTGAGKVPADAAG
jgi:hypothetical protein